MPVLTDHGGDALAPNHRSYDGDPYIRLREVLTIRRGHLPQNGVPLRSEPDSPDDCRVITQRDTEQFRFKGKERWAAYKDILDWKRERRSPTSNVVPPARDFVFAPVKVVLAERDWPIRAVLTYEAICPNRAKIGILHPKSSLWLAYAALAVLNSTIGQALYKELLQQREGRSRTPNGLSTNVLGEIPIAAADFSEDQIKRVVHLSHQVVSLYEAQEESGVYLKTAISSTRERLLGEICRLLKFSEERARDLIAAVSDLELDDHPKPDPQLELFYTATDIPPLPPVDLLSAEDRNELQSLVRRHHNGGVPDTAATTWTRLRLLRLWEERLSVLPPRYLESAVPTNENHIAAFPIERMHGVPVPVQLVREKFNGELYTFYPLGKHIVAAPNVHGGLATFKYTRLDVRSIIPEIQRGVSTEQIVTSLHGQITPEAVEEARSLTHNNAIQVFEKPLAPLGEGH